MKIVWNMRFKMFLAALVINVLGIIFAMLLFYHYAAEHFYSEYAASLQERVFIGAKNADAAFPKIYRATLDISFDAQVSELINRGDFATLATRLRNYREKNSLADDIYIFLPDKKILIRSEEYNSVQTLNETTAAAWKKIIDGQSGMRPIFAENILSPAAKKIFLYKAKVQGSDAFVTTQISERGFYYNFIDDLGAGDSNIALMSDAAGNIVSQSRAYSNLNGNDFIRAEVEMPLSHYSIQLLVSKKKIHGKITFMQILSVLGVIFILLLSTFLLYMLAAKLNEPVENLAQVMQDVGHGNFSLRATVDGNDEIAYLAERFNHMLDNLENEKFLKRHAELHALQYQIRPHFIYNTLNSIRFAAMIQGAKNIGELLANFIELLQVSTNREGEFGTLAEEISTLKKYIALQEFRLMNSFAVDFIWRKKLCRVACRV